MSGGVDYSSITPVNLPKTDKCNTLPCVGDGSSTAGPYIYYMETNDTPDSTNPNTVGTNGLPTWQKNEELNDDWLVGCDWTGQIIDENNTNLNPVTGQPYSALFEPNPDGTYGGTYNPTTGISSGGTAVPFTVFKCPPVYTSTIDCSDRCGDGIYDGLLTFADFGRQRTTKPYPTGVNGYTPRNPEIGFDYAERMPVETCDTGTFYAEDPLNPDPLAHKKKLGYNPEGWGDPTGLHGCDEMCQVMPGWTCTHFFYKMLRRGAYRLYDDATPDYQLGVGVEEPLFRSECYQDNTEGPWRRRLNPEDFDPHGRYLHHLPRRHFNYLLPQSTHEFIDASLKLSPKIGLNGQMRIIEVPCQIATFGCTSDQYKAAVVYGYEN